MGWLVRGVRSTFGTQTTSSYFRAAARAKCRISLLGECESLEKKGGRRSAIDTCMHVRLASICSKRLDSGGVKKKPPGGVILRYTIRLWAPFVYVHRSVHPSVGRGAVKPVSRAQLAT